MRLTPRALVVCCLALAPFAQAQATARQAALPRTTGAELDVAREIAQGEAKFRAGALAAGVVIATFVSGENDVSEVIVSEDQRDAVLDVLQDHHYFERLAQLYAAILDKDELQTLANWYSDPRIDQVWQFQTAIVASVWSLGIGTPVQLPDTLASTAENVDTPKRERIEALLQVWPRFTEGMSDADRDIVIDGIQARITDSDAALALACGQAHRAGVLVVDGIQSDAKARDFDRKEMESPRLRADLTEAVGGES